MITMKKLLLFPIIAIISTQCSQKSTFEAVDCDSNGQIENENLRHIFKPCREFIYSAKYWDQEYNQISNELIRVVVNGNAWDYQPESQDEIIMQYAYDSTQIDIYKEYSLNPEIAHWTDKSTTGIIESVERVWMHPFRDNQYTFTEVAPFPSVNLPLEAGKTWSSGLSIYEGWGVWADSRLENSYEVVGYELVELELGNVDAWHIYGVGTATFGTSTHNYWFHPDYGFIKMVYKNYAGQLLKFELVEVNDL